MEFNESKPKENLARAFAGLCQDGARYQFIAKSAFSEGYAYISDLMVRFAKNKMAHASTLYRTMIDKINKSKDNVKIEAGYPFEDHILKTSLLDSAEIEEYQSKNVYPHFAKIAKDEGFLDIEKYFSLIAKVGEENSLKLRFLADKFENKSLYKREQKTKWICSNCGHSEESKQAWETCPLCNYPKGYVVIAKDTKTK